MNLDSPRKDLNNEFGKSEQMALNAENCPWPQDFVRFYEFNLAKYVRIANLIVQSRQVSEDIVQDAFIRVANKWSKIENHEAFLRKAVVNSCNSYFRRRKLERLYSARYHNPGEITNDDRNELGELLLRLSIKQRVAVTLRFYEDLSDKEIAEVIGCNPNSIPSLISRALNKLNGEISKDGN
ncbi:MAG: sigma-70 family RNA polymerase sigma factor [Acidimicrobiales bacterium]|nr:sigma-70 family RNA polymerase sigma factor [Acidimicrobiales bacterium]